MTVLYRAGKTKLLRNDYRLLDALYRCQSLSTLMIRDWFFPHNDARLAEYHRLHPTIKAPGAGRANWCRFRLRQLTKAGYLVRGSMPKGLFHIDRSRTIYRLSKQGLHSLWEKQGSEEPPPAWDEDLTTVTRRSDVYHLLEQNAIWTRIFTSARSAGLSIEEWRHDEETKKNEEPIYVYIKISQAGERRRRGIRPDGWFMVKLPGTSYPALSFLEHERGTVTGQYRPLSRSFARGRRDWRQKVLALKQYYTPGEGGEPSLLKQQFGSDSLRILVTLTTEEKLLYRKRLTELNGGGEGRFFFTTLKRILMPSTNYFTDPIWHVAGWEGLYCLVEIPKK